MEPLAAGFWGAYFGTAGLLLGGAVLAFNRSARRVAVTGSLAAVLSALYVMVYLGLLPGVEDESQLRMQAQLAALSAAVLGLLLFNLLGLLRERRVAVRATLAMAVAAFTVSAAGWLLSPLQALALGAALEALVIPFAFVASLRTALRGARAGWLAVVGICCMALAVTGLTWHALEPDRTPWTVHAASALAAMAYLVCMAAAMWTRYAYLIDVRQAMVHGPSFDPVTRLRSHTETGAMVSDAFKHVEDRRPVGVIAVSISNLQALEQLHGRAAYNHALFICATRLRRLASPAVELGRLRDDSFLMLVRRPANATALVELAQEVVRRLSRPVTLGTSGDMAALETSRMDWVADIGVGLLMAPPDMKPSMALAGARAMARTAWSFPSRVAWYDDAARQITELGPSKVPAAVAR
jgi:GGDEF domain-containing protein